MRISAPMKAAAQRLTLPFLIFVSALLIVSRSAEAASPYPVSWSPWLVSSTPFDSAIAALALDPHASRSSYVIPS